MGTGSTSRTLGLMIRRPGAALPPPRVLVMTVVHHPWDARIWHRQIAALRQRGWSVTYAAPFTGYGIPVPTPRRGFEAVDLPRSRGRRRLSAQRGARSVLRRLGPAHDVVLLHDPELLTATVRLTLPPVVWDVHEDPGAAVEIRAWLPGALRRPAAAALRWLERWAEERYTLLLADQHYAGRFRGRHEVVPNTTSVVPIPTPAGQLDAAGRHRVVYLGSVTPERGVAEMIEIGRRLREATSGRVVLDVLGPAHGDAGPLLTAAHRAGDLRWHGFVPNAQALLQLDGALAGLSLLHDVANFRPSMPTKVVEYLAHGVPVITSPLPVAAELVVRSGGGLVVPFHDTEETVRQLLAWHDRPEEAARVGRAGHALVQAEYDWESQAEAFVSALETAARSGTP